MTKVITGLFSLPSEGARAIDTIVAKGIPVKNVSLVASDAIDRDAFGVETNSKLPEGAAIGATTGGAIGALVAGLTAVGAIATGGAGLLVAGPIVAAFAGAGAGAAAGSILGGAIGLAIPEHEVKHYEDAINEGSVLVGVQIDDAVERLFDDRDSDADDVVKEVFRDCNAEKVSHA